MDVWLCPSSQVRFALKATEVALRHNMSRRANQQNILQPIRTRVTPVGRGSAEVDQLGISFVSLTVRGYRHSRRRGAQSWQIPDPGRCAPATVRSSREIQSNTLARVLPCQFRDDVVVCPGVRTRHLHRREVHNVAPDQQPVATELKQPTGVTRRVTRSQDGGDPGDDLAVGNLRMRSR